MSSNRPQSLVERYEDPGSYTPTYAVLIATASFWPIVFIIYGICMLMFSLFSKRFCKSCRKIDWTRKLNKDFQSWVLPLISTTEILVALSSVGLFIYYVTTIDNKYNAGQTRQELVKFFEQSWVIWTQFGLALTSWIPPLIRFALLPRKYEILYSLHDWLSISSGVSGILGPFFGFYYWGFQSLQFAQLGSTLSTLQYTGFNIFQGLFLQLILTVTGLIAIIFTVTGLVFTYENVYFTDGILSNYFVAIYMTGITFTTVGYGDFYPISTAGRIVVFLGLLAAFWMIPYLIASIIEPYNRYKAGRKYSGRDHGIIFSKDCNDHLIPIVSEFYNINTTSSQNLLLVSQTIDKEDPKFSLLKDFLKTEFFKPRVQIMNLNWFEPEYAKLSRASRAKFGFLIQDKFPADAETEDAITLTGALSIMHTNPSLPLYIQLSSRSTKMAFEDRYQKNIICMDELRKNMLVQSCLSPGMLSVLTHLLVDKKIQRNDLAIEVATDFTSEEYYRVQKSWLSDYRRGLAFQVESMVSLEAVIGTKFAHVAMAMFSLHSIIILSVYNQQEGVIMNPRDRIIQSGDYGQFLHNRGSKHILQQLSSQITQKYLTLLKASYFDETDHVCVEPLTLADMMDSDDFAVAQTFDLYEQTNITQAIRSARTSMETTRERRNSFDDRMESAQASPLPDRPDTIKPTENEPSLLEKSRSITNIMGDANHQHQWDKNAARRLSLESRISNHIILCGRADEGTVEVAEKLVSRTPNDQSIVILLRQVSFAPESVLKKISLLDSMARVDCLIGLPMDPFDLRRAGVMSARVCLLLPDCSDLNNVMSQTAQDSNLLVSYHLLLQTDTFPIIELMKPESEQLLMNVAGADKGFSIAAAAGFIFRRSLFDNLLVQSYYKPNLIPLFEQLAGSTISHFSLKRIWDELIQKESEEVEMTRTDDGDDNSNQKKKKKKKDPSKQPVLFGQVFAYLIKYRGLISFAIYRKKRDAEDQWFSSHSAKTKSNNFVSAAGRAFRRKKIKSELPQSEVRIAIISPRNNTPMVKTDLLFVIPSQPVTT